jgi:glycosyltransferase involved in cell wall biosynthesis
MVTVEDPSSAQNHFGPARRIASVSKYIPFPSITHAGGQYVGRHLDALASVADVALLAPDTPLNRDAAPLFRGEADVRLLRGVGPGGRGRFKTLFDFESAWRGSAVALPYRRLFETSRGPWAELTDVDLIEFHWSEMIAVAPLVRRRLPRVPLVGIAHDVITQRWERAAAYALAADRSRRTESRSFASLDALLVFSEKDADLARALSPRTRVEVVHPGLGPTETISRVVDRTSPIVLFTGALNRSDNERGILWFLERVWPRVQAAVPTAQLVIAGANPQPPLVRAVSKAARTVLTGFVESLEPWYAQAAVFIAPLHTGAGVKFKTIDAMLRGVPVVSTTVGAEGIAAKSMFVGITDVETEFGDAVIAELQTPDVTRAEQARDWADHVYGVAAFHERLRTLYTELLPGE